MLRVGGLVSTALLALDMLSFILTLAKALIAVYKHSSSLHACLSLCTSLITQKPFALGGLPVSLWSLPTFVAKPYILHVHVLHINIGGAVV